MINYHLNIGYNLKDSWKSSFHISYSSHKLQQRWYKFLLREISFISINVKSSCPVWTYSDMLFSSIVPLQWWQLGFRVQCINLCTKIMYCAELLGWQNYVHASTLIVAKQEPAEFKCYKQSLPIKLTCSPTETTSVPSQGIDYAN